MLPIKTFGRINDTYRYISITGIKLKKLKKLYTKLKNSYII